MCLVSTRVKSPWNANLSHSKTRYPWLGIRVKRRAEVVPAAAAVQNHQFRHLCGRLGFAFWGQELLKLTGRCFALICCLSWFRFSVTSVTKVGGLLGL